MGSRLKEFLPVIAVVGVYVLSIYLYTGIVFWNYHDWVVNASPLLTSSLNTVKYLMLLEAILIIPILLMCWERIKNWGQSPDFFHPLLTATIVVFKIISLIILYENWQIFISCSLQLHSLKLGASMTAFRWVCRVYVLYTVVMKGILAILILLAVYKKINQMKENIMQKI